MRTVDLDDAKTHLSQLVEEATKGYPFVITKAGQAMVKVIPLIGASNRIGFMTGRISVPNDFDQMGSEHIERLFDGES